MTFHIAIVCPNCKTLDKYVPLPEPFIENYEKVQEKTRGKISTWFGTCGYLVCQGCLDMCEVEFIKEIL